MAAAAAVQHALDTELGQCLVDFFDDASGLHWHHRLLLVEGETGQWIAATPDFDVELLDLSSHRVVPLTRRMVVPAARAAESYMFDPLNDGEENTLLDQGRALARLLGFKVATAAATTGSSWRISDVAHEHFGHKVPPEALSLGGPDEIVTREAVGLVRVDGAWVTMERVDDSKLETWKDSKTTACGRDRRVLPWLGEDTPEGDRLTSRTQAQAIQIWRKGSKPKFFPFDGPQLLVEYFDCLEESGLTLTTHHLEWSRSSGVGEASSAARWHKTLCETLRLLGFVDQLDLAQSTTAEYLTRELVKVEMAVERNAKVPDWEGLKLITGTRISDGGAVTARKFLQWVGAAQKDEAFVMKQQRQLRDEKDAAAKKKKGGKGGDGRAEG